MMMVSVRYRTVRGYEGTRVLYGVRVPLSRLEPTLHVRYLSLLGKVYYTSAVAENYWTRL